MGLTVIIDNYFMFQSEDKTLASRHLLSLACGKYKQCKLNSINRNWYKFKSSNPQEDDSAVQISF